RSSVRPPAPVVAPAAPPPMPPPVPPPAPPGPTPVELARPSIIKAAAVFVAWAEAHGGAQCPSHGELGALLDPWGHRLAITCSDQPAGERIGVVSLGPDGKLGTDDDIASWDLTDALRGSRWAPRVIVRRPPPPPPAAKQVAPQGKTFAGTTLGNDGIPT